MAHTMIAKNTLFKGLALVTVIFVGVTLGVYLGYALVGTRTIQQSDLEHRVVDVGESAMNLSVGDLFPLEDCTLPDGTRTSFEDILSGHKTLLVFASAGCEPCTEFFNYFKTIKSHVQDDVQILVSLSDHNPELSEQYRQLLDSYTNVFMDADMFAEKYNIVVYPTVLGIDRSGFITHIQYVPKDWLEDDLEREYATNR